MIKMNEFEKYYLKQTQILFKTSIKYGKFILKKIFNIFTYKWLKIKVPNH